MFGVDQDVPADFMEAARSLYDIAFGMDGRLFE
jgi:hypothetical protein